MGLCLAKLSKATGQFPQCLPSLLRKVVLPAQLGLFYFRALMKQPHCGQRHFTL